MVNLSGRLVQAEKALYNKECEKIELNGQFTSVSERRIQSLILVTACYCFNCKGTVHFSVKVCNLKCQRRLQVLMVSGFK